jgi:hypothetical protein
VETTGQVRDPQTERTHALHSALLAGNAIEMLSLLTAHLPSTSLGAWRLHMFGIAAACSPYGGDEWMCDARRADNRCLDKSGIHPRLKCPFRPLRSLRYL